MPPGGGPRATPARVGVPRQTSALYKMKLPPAGKPSMVTATSGREPRPPVTLLMSVNIAARSISFGEWAAAFGSLAAAGAVAIPVGGAARTRYRRTIGRRRDLERRLQRLGTGVHLEYFESVLGWPPAIRRSFARGIHAFHESIFVHELCYVLAFSDKDGTVVGFSITTRAAAFQPTIMLPGKPVKLGHTTFAQAGAGAVEWNMGNKEWSYVEVTSDSNPTYYQQLAVAATRVSPAAREPKDVDQANWTGGTWSSPAHAPEWVQRYRSSGVITTVAVTRLNLKLKDWPQLAPSVDQMRTLP
jgi:hypothetical protein